MPPVPLIAAVAVVLAAAHGCGRLAVRAGQPRVVGELLGAGVVAGPTVLGAVAAGVLPAPLHVLCATTATGGSSVFSCLFPEGVQTAIAVEGEAGVFLYMVAVGVRIDRGLLRSEAGLVVRLSAGTVLVPLACACVLVVGLSRVGLVDPGLPVAAAVLGAGALLVVTALPVAVRLLDEQGLRCTPFGVAVVGTAAVTAVIAFLALLAGAALAGQQTAGLTGWLALPALMAVAGGGVLWSGRAGAGPAWRRAALALAVAAAAGLLARHAGLTVAVGGLLAGLAVPGDLVSARRVGAVERLALRWLLPLFFAVAGFDLDLSTLGGGDLLVVVAVVALGVGGKFAGALIGGRGSGVAWRDAVAAGAILNCRGLLVLVVSLQALELGLVDTGLHAAAVALALVTTAMTGPVLGRARPGGEPTLRRAAA